MQTDRDVIPDAVLRVMWNEHSDCCSRLPGGWDIDDTLRGSFIVYVCDRPGGHGGLHRDSHLGMSWGSVQPVPVGAFR